MELQFEKREIQCLSPVLTQVQNLEQTQEIHLTGDNPDIARILGVWGQIVMRSKEWNRDCVQTSGGVMMWLLYEAGDGSGLKKADTWIPYKMDWDLPELTPEGKARLQFALRNVDARLVSAGKVLIRAGIAMMAECWSANTVQVKKFEETSQDVQLLNRKWPLRLPKEAGEKIFEMEDQLTLPPSAPDVEELVYYRADPEVTDKKIVGNKLVFRGKGNLHILYRSEDGTLRNWDFEMPFSQYAQLEASYSTDACADVMMVVTRLDVEMADDGKLRLNAGLTGQYLVGDRELVETVEDAYSLNRQLQMEREEVKLPGILDSRQENLYGEQLIPIQADMIVDASMTTDFARVRRDGDLATLEQPGMVQILYYDANGTLQSTSQRWMEGQTLRTEVPVQITFSTAAGVPAVTQITLGERLEQDPGRPSLILRRATGEPVWNLAKDSGSTVAAIQKANGLETDPVPGRILLIPVL